MKSALYWMNELGISTSKEHIQKTITTRDLKNLYVLSKDLGIDFSIVATEIANFLTQNNVQMKTKETEPSISIINLEREDGEDCLGEIPSDIIGDIVKFLSMNDVILCQRTINTLFSEDESDILIHAKLEELLKRPSSCSHDFKL